MKITTQTNKVNFSDVTGFCNVNVKISQGIAEEVKKTPEKEGISQNFLHDKTLSTLFTHTEITNKIDCSSYRCVSNEVY